jgi:phosphoribosylanthranilate isomerase
VRLIVKICGLTRPEDAADAVRAGADWIGINFWPRSKRYCRPQVAAQVAAAARQAGEVQVVGVFVNQSQAEIDDANAMVGLDLVQLHGDESPEFCRGFAGRYLKALALREAADVERIRDYDSDVVLVDTPTSNYGGSGQIGDWNLARAAVATGRRIVLAGGLTPENVGAAIATVGPYGVDVAGGVEQAPGVKNAEQVARFVAAARNSR